jgi:hypothetical protein
VFVAAAWAAGIASPTAVAAVIAATPSQATLAGLRMGFLLPVAGTGGGDRCKSTTGGMSRFLNY